jgi:hypothetical protein
MSFSIYGGYAPNPCEEEVVSPVCDPCLSDIEHGRVRSVGYVHKNYYPVLMADPSNPVLWQQGIVARSIMIIPETQGTFDGGSPVEGAGYGDQATKLIGFTFSLGFKDPNFKTNTPHYNTVMRSSSWHVCWRTENLTRVSSKPATFIPKSPVGEDLNSEVVWDVEAKWSEPDQPVPFQTPSDVFVCPN